MVGDFRTRFLLGWYSADYSVEGRRNVMGNRQGFQTRVGRSWSNTYCLIDNTVFAAIDTKDDGKLMFVIKIGETDIIGFRKFATDNLDLQDSLCHVGIDNL